ncbi:MAG: SGNH/GDSL hydrolase family protein [Bryobacteraceae bacterium]
MRRLSACTLICILASPAFLPVSAATTAKSGKKKSAKKPAPKRKHAAYKIRHYAPPRVSAAVRAASLEKVAIHLETPPDPAIERPGALVPFLERLYRLSNEGGPPVHILHYGDSHTAADEWTGGLRDLFQRRFGNGGAGFSFAGVPFKGYRRLDLRVGASKFWEPAGMRTGEGDGLYGLGGISIEALRPGQFIVLDADCDSVELDYLQQPEGGRARLSDNGIAITDLSTQGPLMPAFVEYPIAPGRHHFELRTLDAGPVRLFGWVTHNQAGVTYESMGINGAEAAVIQRWDEPMQAFYLQRRDPALIVLAYGTNEAGDSKWTESTYQETFSGVLKRLRKAAPAASILVVGPPDRLTRVKGRWRPFNAVDRIVAAQREACEANGCAYWNLRARMGDEGSMLSWVMAGLAQGDYVHFTAAGYQRLAEILFQDIMRQYEKYLKVRLEVSTQLPDEPTSQDH